MPQRIGFGVLFIGFLVLLFVQDVIIARQAVNVPGALGELLRRGSLIPLLFVSVFLRASVELRHILEAREARPHARFATVMILVFLLLPWLSAAGWLGTGVEQQEGWTSQLIAGLVSVLGSAMLTVARRDPQHTIRDTSATLLMVFYLGFLGSFGLVLRCGRDIPAQEGAWLLLLVLLITKITDIGAYFVGTALGRHKLIPSVSPGKSIEGALGGLGASAVFAGLVAVVPAILSEQTTSGMAWWSLLHDMTRSFSARQSAAGMSPVLRAVIIGVALSAVGQIGDLFESCLKRDSRIKDSGRLIPGYGGILDMIDSPVFAMPVAWVLLTTVFDVV